MTQCLLADKYAQAIFIQTGLTLILCALLVAIILLKAAPSSND